MGTASTQLFSVQVQAHTHLHTLYNVHTYYLAHIVIIHTMCITVCMCIVCLLLISIFSLSESLLLLRTVKYSFVLLGTYLLDRKHGSL